MDSVQLEQAQKEIRFPFGKTVMQKIPGEPAALMNGCGAIGRKVAYPVGRTAAGVL